MKPTTQTFWKIVILSTLVFFFSWLGVYKLGVNQLPIQSEDTLPAMFLPVTIIQEGTIYLDTYYDLFLQHYPHPDDRTYEKGFLPFYLRQAGDHYVSAFPIITSLLALPFYFIPLKLGVPISLETVTYLGHFSAAAIMAFSGGFLYLLLRKHFSLDEKKAKLLTVVYLFATINFALISQALWQHGTAELLFILALWFMYEKKWFWMAFVLSLAVISRPTAALVFPFLSLIFIEKTWSNFREFIKPLSRYVLGLVPPILFFTWYTNTYYLGIVNNGYSDQWFSGWQSKFPEGLLGLLLSPSKGILIYSPIIVFAIIGAYLALRNKQWKTNLNYVVLASVVLMHVLVMSIWKHWYGGWSFGYRMASDVIPFMILLMVPYVQSELFEKTKRWFYFLFGFSVLVQVFGIVFFDGIWHAAYDGGFKDTGWLWSIKDSEFAFNIRRLLVKVGVLAKACPQCLENL
ncbi:hypothetical protein A2886_00820 [candidate division WWE3 bacterium RIFCSPHIGHO2_01_FULL_42_13]|uniref:Glycosyltransferase RgtA/B/C/D-like domain-containing protein n=1 Tax=candidate division WWE3 bacterium RIFCSPHIGHO2_01_FULL_42_13 TaxID=1802617 RepID=A0A1F4USL9_UNCKA|nr:MAG: hypothetical protein A2886_00820 [candidate division WWE3 bacterium RIFCSPHIGHO2_01_FULL_42_13]